jgi:hypothetical protein
VVFEPVEVPALVEARTPAFVTSASDSGAFWLSIQRKGVWLAHDLQTGNQVTLAQDREMLLNWADFPRLLQESDGYLSGFWLKRRPSKGFHYDIETIRLNTKTVSIISQGKPYPEDVDAEHGFGALGTLEGETWLAWVDGSNYANLPTEHTHALSGFSTLRASKRGPRGTWLEPVQLDGRICDCCQMAMVNTGNALVLFYRDRSDEEIRDIYYVRYENGVWSAPKQLAPDSWVITACPVNGPSAASLKKDVMVAWFTSALAIGTVKVAWSSDGGKRFGPARTIAEQEVIGRVSTAMDSRGDGYVSWLKPITSDNAVVMVTKVTRTGFSQPVPADTVQLSRASGFPVLSVRNDVLWLASTKESGISLKKVIL